MAKPIKVSVNITTGGQFSEWMILRAGQRYAASVHSAAAWTGTVSVQRRFGEQTARIVKSYVDTDKEEDGIAALQQEVRIGSTGFSAGTITAEIWKEN